MIRLTDLIIPLDYDNKTLELAAAKKLDVSADIIINLRVVKVIVNNRDKKNIHFLITVLVSLTVDENIFIAVNRDKSVSLELRDDYIVPKLKGARARPVVVGFGPAGIFAALILAEAGAKPIVLERGKDVAQRRHSVSEFWQRGILDTNSNVQFGEGGAGTFSDGKLKIGKRDKRKLKILNEFVEAGAPPEILYLGKPHIGTDRLGDVVKGIRNKIISLGGEVCFNSRVTDILHSSGQVRGVGYLKNGVYEELPASDVIISVGHSARDTFSSFHSCGICMEQKPFAIGVRIEHPQKLIDKIQYGDYYGHPSLGAADYKMVVHLQGGRNVYTFCMCPGGAVVAATSEKGCLVTNGMSEYARNGDNSNSALFVTIHKDDLKSDHPLAGMWFQQKIEKAAFEAGGGDYKAPVQRLDDFLNRKNTTGLGNVFPTYMPGTRFAEIDSYMPEYVSNSLRSAIFEMENWMPGFGLPDALLTGAETRSSSPVLIRREENMQAIGIGGLYPCGEGAGYAGGIISAAVDGMICAEKILNS